MPRILVVDDEPEVRNLLRRFFAAKNYNVLTAASGAECLTTLEQQEVDAVLLDLIMPVMSGVEVLSEIRAQRPDLPVVMVTGETDEELAKEALALGAFDYVLKPLNFDYLERTLYIKLAQKLL